MANTYKYILDFVGNNRQLVGAIDQNKAKLTELDRKADDSKKSIANVFSGTKEIQAGLMSFAGTVGLAFGAREIVSFTGELVKLGGEATGVQDAFNKIADSSDLTKLRSSVHGTVSDLELMKRAVSAQNFGIPVKELGNLFTFATKRAQDTGQSVDYLVDSIVTGIGRKSPLILDNLGISATALKDKMHGVAIESAGVADITKAVGEIAADSFKKTGDILDTNAIKLQSLSAQWENFKMQLATNEGFQETASGAVDRMSNLMEVFFSKNLSGWDKFQTGLAATMWGWGGYIDNMAATSRKFTRSQTDNTSAVKEFQRTYNNFLPAAKPFRFYDKTEDVKNFNEFWATVTKTALPAMFKVIPGNISTTKTYANTYEGLNEKLKDYNEQLAKITPGDTAATTAKLQQILAIEKQIKAVDELKTKLEAIAKVNADPMRGQKMVTIMPTWVTNGGFNLDTPITTNSETNLVEKKKDPVAEFVKQQEKLRTEMQKTADIGQAVGQAIGDSFAQFGQRAVESFGLASTGFEGFIGNMLTGVTKLLGMLLANAIGNAIVSGSLSASFSGPGAVFTLPAFIAAGVASVMSAFAAIPAFADGGVVYGPTLGLMGEYPGARSNPEIIAPLSKLQAMIGGGGSQQIILQPGIDFDGDKLRVFLKRLEAKAAKRNG